MNMQVLDACDGYRVDVNRGERVGRMYSEWFLRPADERYLSLTNSPGRCAIVLTAVGHAWSKARSNRRAPGGLFLLHARPCLITRTTVTPCGTSLTAQRDTHRLCDRAGLRDSTARSAKSPSRLHFRPEARRFFRVIKRELRRSSAIEPIIGYLKPKVTSAAATSKAGPAMPPTSSSQRSITTSPAASPG